MVSFRAFCCLLIVVELVGCGIHRDADENPLSEGGLRVTMPKTVFQEGEPVWYYLTIHPRQEDQYVLSCVDAFVLQVDLRSGDQQMEPIPFSTDVDPPAGRDRFAGVYDRWGNLVKCPVIVIPTAGLNSMTFRVPLNYDANISHEVFDLGPGDYNLRVSYLAQFGFEHIRILKETGAESIEQAGVFGASDFVTSNRVSFVVQ